MEKTNRTYAVNVKQNISSYHLFFVKAYTQQEARELALAEAEQCEFGPTHIYYTVDAIHLIPKEGT